jgi:hypothetical protein
MAQRNVNSARGAKIGKALERAGYEGAPDWRATVSDALTDLRHLCDTHGLDFGDCDRSAYEHYLAELHARDAEAQDSESHFERTGKL